ncbi:MAG: hypothetical protein OEN02_13075 [Gammaproteobacteria bacterium]|nr:hypothetical protein [Gammaproteobacteria bacterium]
MHSSNAGGRRMYYCPDCQPVPGQAEV